MQRTFRFGQALSATLRCQAAPGWAGLVGGGLLPPTAGAGACPGAGPSLHGHRGRADRGGHRLAGDRGAPAAPSPPRPIPSRRYWFGPRAGGDGERTASMVTLAVQQAFVRWPAFVARNEALTG